VLIEFLHARSVLVWFLLQVQLGDESKALVVELVHVRQDATCLLVFLLADFKIVSFGLICLFSMHFDSEGLQVEEDLKVVFVLDG
jgi:hypothetical protein